MSDAPKPPRDPAAASPAAAPAPPLSSAQAKIQAALANEGLQEALRELDEARAEPDPAAPDPIIVLPEKGGEVLVADVEAAAAYVRPTLRRSGPVPQDTLTRVHVDVRVDPRRQPTERKLRSDLLPGALNNAAAKDARKSSEHGAARAEPEQETPPANGGAAVSPWTHEANAPALHLAALPSSHAPSSRPPPSVTVRPAPASIRPAVRRTSLRRAVWAGVTSCGLFLVVVLALHGSGGGRNETTGAAPPHTSIASAATTGIAMTATTSASEATTVDAATTATAAPDASGATTGASSAPPMVTGARPATPRSTGDDPYADAGPPKSIPSQAPAVPAPVVTSAPTVTPTAPATATTTSRPFAPFTLEKDG